MCCYRSFMAANDRGRARMTAALGNHRRIEIIRMLRGQPAMCIEEVAAACKVDVSTASEHVRRLHESGRVKKKSKGRRVVLSATKRASTMLRTIDLLWDLPRE
jgi:predicted transcriptional regulator